MCSSKSMGYIAFQWRFRGVMDEKRIKASNGQARARGIWAARDRGSNCAFYIIATPYYCLMKPKSILKLHTQSSAPPTPISLQTEFVVS